ncbi:hypothetical protein ACFX13_009472 [Malus domestica]
MVGLSGALETLCGQGFEARDYTRANTCFYPPGQRIAKYAALYISFIPGLFSYASLYFFSVIQMVVHVVITYSLVHWTAHCVRINLKLALPSALMSSIFCNLLILADRNKYWLSIEPKYSYEDGERERNYARGLQMYS